LSVTLTNPTHGHTATPIALGTSGIPQFENNFAIQVDKCKQCRAAPIRRKLLLLGDMLAEYRRHRFRRRIVRLTNVGPGREFFAAASSFSRDAPI
jgi:hypothetical protein